MLVWPSKDPDEVLDYEADWATYRLQTGETISSSDFSVVEGSVTIDSEPPPVAGICTVWLSGGAAGDLCIILNRITTNLNRTYDQSFKLRIKSH